MSKRKNPRFVKVKTIIDSEDIKLLLSSNAINSRSVRQSVIDSSVDIRKNDDDNTALIQRDLNRVENVLEKVLYLSCILILINVIVLCIC